jgi:hypothetical protein
MTDYKALLYQYNKALASGGAYKCYRLSDRTVYFLRIMTEYIGWKPRYENMEEWQEEDRNNIKTWREAAWDELHNPQECEDGCQEQCVEYSPTDDRVTYFPQDPVDSPTFVPPSYQQPPWHIVRPNDITLILGNHAGDIMTDLACLPSAIENLPQGLPAIRITVQGKGRLRVHLVGQPQGGFAAITKDDQILSTYLVDTSSIGIGEILTTAEAIGQFLPIPIVGQGIYPLITEEIDFDTDGEHWIDIRPIPKIGEDVLLGYGMGFRKFEWCGVNVVDDCCGETRTIVYRQTQITRRQVQMQNNYLYDGTPESIAPGIPDDTYAHSSTDTTPEQIDAGRRALCLAIKSYVHGLLNDAVSMTYAAGAVVGTLASVPFLAIPVVAAAIAAAATVLTLEQVQALQDPVAIQKVICCMFEYLQDKPPTERAVFQHSAENCGFEFPDNAAHLAGRVHNDNQLEPNWFVFLQCVEEARATTSLNPYEGLDCETCCDDDNLIVIADGTIDIESLVITPLGNKHWRFVNNVRGEAHFVATGQTRYFMKVKEQNGNCMKFEPPDPGYENQSAAFFSFYDCAGIEDSNVGGFGGDATRVGIAYGDPLNTVFKITCAE